MLMIADWISLIIKGDMRITTLLECNPMNREDRPLVTDELVEQITNHLEKSMD